METSELVRKVRKIEIKTKGISNHLFAGQYHSAFKGRGMSFSEVRSYQYGDDVRNIDWNVTARTGHPFVKIFEEERELTTMLLADVSASNFFGTAEQFKKELITEICAVLAFSAIQNNDKVGILLFSEKVELYIPPKKGRAHILRIIRELLNFEPTGRGTDISAAFQFLNRVIKKRCICFLLSDFMTEHFETALSITARRHDVVGIQVCDPADAEIPNIGLVRVNDAETGAQSWIDTSNAGFRARYRLQFERLQQNAKSAFLRNNADFLTVSTDKPYIQTLLQFFKSRNK